MPISVFENRFETPVTFILEPGGEQHELPSLAKIGVRYSFSVGQADQTFTDIGHGIITFWCDAQLRETEIVHAGPFNLLLQDICVNGGCCGGAEVRVVDLLSEQGTVTAADFARLVLQAEGGGSDESEAWLVAKFVEHMGGTSVPAAALVQTIANPFDGDAT